MSSHPHRPMPLSGSPPEMENKENIKSSQTMLFLLLHYAQMNELKKGKGREGGAPGCSVGKGAAVVSRG